MRLRTRPALAGSDVWIWIAAAFSLALVLAATVLSIVGVGERGLFIALRVSARFSFIFFWAAYASGALASLYGPAFEPLARRRRQFGLSFAAAHVVHLGLVIWLYRISTEPPIPISSAVLFSIGFLWLFVLTLLSINLVREFVPGPAWRVLQTVGLEYIAYLFFADFFRPSSKQAWAYLPFAAMVVVGLALRLTAMIKAARPGLWATVARN